jgi:hypothetical protein
MSDIQWDIRRKGRDWQCEAPTSSRSRADDSHAAPESNSLPCRAFRRRKQLLTAAVS